MQILIDDVRTFAQAVMIGCSGEIDVLWLDHDLGEEKTGYDLISWAMRVQIKPEKVRLITQNPVGRENMAKCLKASGYVENTIGCFVRKEEK